MSLITISRTLPASVAHTFEAHFLTRMIPFETTDDGLWIGGDTEDVNLTMRFSQDLLMQMFQEINRHPSVTGVKLLPLIQQRLSEESGEIEIDDLSDLGIDIEHLLQSLCQRFPNEFDFFEVAWAYTEGRFHHGNFGGGAYFITADSIDGVITHKFLDEKRAAFGAKASAAPASGM
jgi:hypothetical protein